MDWSDLRIALLLGRHGSIRSTARALGVSHSTVLRRLRVLESAVGSELFVQRDGRYHATTAGLDVIETAASLEDSVTGLERRVAGRDSRLVGDVRVTVPDPFAPMLAPIFAEIGRLHPGIELTIGLSTHFADLNQRVADIAVRTTGTPPADLIGRRLGTAAIGIYGSQAYLDGRTTNDLESLDWVGWERGSSMWFNQWMIANVPNARVRLRVSAGWGLREGVDAGVGVAIVPCALGEFRPNWRRIRLVPEGETPLWILSHRDLRDTARVRAVREALAEAIVARMDRIQGVAPPL